MQTNKIRIAITCTNSTDKFLEFFFNKQSFPHVFEMIGYSSIVGFVLQACIIFDYFMIFIEIVDY